MENNFERITITDEESKETAEMSKEKDGMENNEDVEIQSDSVRKHSMSKKKKITIIVSSVLAVIIMIGVGIGISVSISNQKIKEAKDDYLQKCYLYSDLLADAGNNLGEIRNTIATYWYENIFESKHGEDINEAYGNAIKDKSSEIIDAHTFDSQIQNLYSEIKQIPEIIPEDEREELNEICQTAKEYYGIYCDLFDCTLDPTGKSYQEYVDDYKRLIGEFKSLNREYNSLL